MPTDFNRLKAAAAKAGAPDVDFDEEEEYEEEPEEEVVEPEPTTPPKEPQGSARPEGEGTEFPEDFWGVNVAEYAEKHGEEAAKEFMESMAAANRGVSSRMRELADQRKAVEEAHRSAVLEAQKEAALQGATSLDDMSEDDILEAAGFDPSDYEYEELKGPAVKMARKILELDEKISTVTTSTQERETEREFRSRLSELERDTGVKLLDPETGKAIEWDDLKAYAIDVGIFEPDALYWRIAGPAVLARQGSGSKGTKPRRKGTDPLSDLKRAAAAKRRRSPASGSTQKGKTKGLLEHYEQAKKQLDVKDADPFAY